MIDLEGLARQVARNCRISDSRFWGYHSVCGLLLRLRELFKWEHGLEPWDRTEKEAVMAWIGGREGEWSELEEAELADLDLGGAPIDPFDVDAVNASLLPGGHLYGAGRGLFGKPLFVLGEVARREEVDGAEVFTLGRELVRDLSPVPAMNRDHTIVARRDAMKWYLWWQIEEESMKKDSSLCALALGQDGIDLAALVAEPAAEAAWLKELTLRETEVAVHHELGEIREERRRDGRWGQVLTRACGQKAELLARGLKDVLADTGDGGRLQYIIEERMLPSLGLYAAFSEGLRKRLFPGLGGLFREVAGGGDWGRADAGRRETFERLSSFAGPLLDLLEEDLDDRERNRRVDEFEERMLG